MATQRPFLYIHTSMKRPRRTYGFPPSIPFILKIPVTITVFPCRFAVINSGRTCCTPADFTSTRTSGFVMSRPSKSTYKKELSSNVSIAVTSLISAARAHAFSRARILDRVPESENSSCAPRGSSAVASTINEQAAKFAAQRLIEPVSAVRVFSLRVPEPLRPALHLRLISGTSTLEDRMSRISLIAPEAASPEVEEIYDKVLRGKPGNAQKALAHR